MRLDNDLHDSDPQEREISLGTATILGIFLALALVCAAFFGFGYSLGRHSSPAPAATAPEMKSDRTGSPFSDFKSPAKAHADDESADTSSAETPSPSSTSTEKAPVPVSVPPNTAKAPTATHTVGFPVPPQQSAAASSLPTGSAQFLVQVSATSRQGDAESLIAALRQKGYIAAIRQEPQDKLFHVQLGPFATKKGADAMRQRLDTDGYKAIVK